RALYTELIKDSESAITSLGHNLPTNQSERRSPGILIIFDELVNYARYSTDPDPFGYLRRIRDELRALGLRFLIIGQEVSHFYSGGDDKFSDDLKLLIAESAVIVGAQADHPANKDAYDSLLSMRSKVTAEQPPDGWGYDFDAVLKLTKPIGQFLLFAKDEKNTSYPLPGLIPPAGEAS